MFKALEGALPGSDLQGLLYFTAEDTAPSLEELWEGLLPSHREQGWSQPSTLGCLRLGWAAGLLGCGGRDGGWGFPTNMVTKAGAPQSGHLQMERKVCVLAGQVMGCVGSFESLDLPSTQPREQTDEAFFLLCIQDTPLLSPPTRSLLGPSAQCLIWFCFKRIARVYCWLMVQRVDAAQGGLG